MLLVLTQDINNNKGINTVAGTSICEGEIEVKAKGKRSTRMFGRSTNKLSSKFDKDYVRIFSEYMQPGALSSLVVRFIIYKDNEVIADLKNIKTLADTCNSGYWKLGIYRHRTIGYWNSDWESLKDQTVYLDSIVLRKPKKDEKFNFDIDKKGVLT